MYNIIRLWRNGRRSIVASRITLGQALKPVHDPKTMTDAYTDCLEVA